MIAQARSATAAVLLLMWTACSLPPCAAQSDPVRTLDPEVVVGHRKPVRADPEVFSPLHNKLWLAGFKETFPSEIPEELKNVDALTRARKLGRLVACADAWYYPFSVTARKTEPPGIDIEIARAIAARQGWTVEIVWANTGPGAALDVAFRRTIDKGYCDFFTGLIITGEDDDVRRHKLMFTEPYIGLGFVLVTQGAALHVRTLEDIKRENIKIGVLMFSPMENYIRMNDIPHELYFQNQRLIDGMVKGQVDAAMMWSGALATLKRDYEAEFDMVSGYVPSPDQRWNGAWALPIKEKELKQFFDEHFAILLKDGEIQRIVERYGVPFYPPFNEK
jgi:ABC-type amino acid transport substrate-binding protein